MLRLVGRCLITKGLECYRNQIMVKQVKVVLAVSMKTQRFENSMLLVSLL